MSSSQSSSKGSPSLQAKTRSRGRGLCVMELTVLLLLYVPLTTAFMVRHPQRPQTDVLSLINDKEKVELVTSHGETSSTATDSRTLDQAHELPAEPALQENILHKVFNVRSRRALLKGCQFGTCQMHNLANTLYVMGQSNRKEQSKNVRDPHGYGR